MRKEAQASTSILAMVAAARVAVGATMILVPSRIFSPGSGTETLLMRTIGIRDVVIGSGACAAWARGDDGMIGGRNRVALGVAAGLPHRLEDARGGPTDCNGIGVLGRQRFDVGQHLQAHVELVRVDRVHRRRVRGLGTVGEMMQCRSRLS